MKIGVALLGALALWGTLLAVESSGQSSGLKDRPAAAERPVAEPSDVSEPFPDGLNPYNCTPPDCRPPSPGGGNGPALVINDVCVAEGNRGDRALNFVVTRVVSQDGIATVHFATANGTATAPSDFTARSGTLTFQPGQENKTVAVQVHGDTKVERDETMRLALSNATGALLTDTSGTGTILNDDGGPVHPCPNRAPILTVRNACVVEGSTGSVRPYAMRFDVVRSGDLSGESLLNFGSRNGTAKSPSDFIPRFGTFRFQTGQTAKFARIDIRADRVPESNETLEFFLFNVQQARVGRGVGVGTIVDDDSGPMRPCPRGGGGGPALSITNARITEGDSGVRWLRFDVTLSAQVTKTVTVHFGTVPGTAKRTADYGFKQGTFTFQPGQTAKLTRIKIVGDTVKEPTEQFTIRMDHAVNARIADGVGVGTIVNDD